MLLGKWLMEAGQAPSGAIINWLVENVLAAAGMSAAGKDGLPARCEEEIQGIPPGSGGLVMLDYMQGNRTPRRDPRAKGAVFGFTLGHDYRHLVRSAYAGIAFGTRHIVETMRAAGIDVRRAAAGGGGARSSSKITTALISSSTKLPGPCSKAAHCRPPGTRLEHSHLPFYTQAGEA